MATRKRGRAIPRVLRIESAIAAAADELLNLWWTAPYSLSKYDYTKEVIRKHLAKAIRIGAAQ